MFDFTFDDAELEALNKLLGMCFENTSAELPDWIFLGHYVWKMDLGTGLHPDTSELPNEPDSIA